MEAPFLLGIGVHLHCPMDPHDDPKLDNPAVSKVVGRNIRTILDLRAKAKQQRTRPEIISDAIVAFSGSLKFLYVQFFLFGLWLLLNSGWLGLPPFDSLPFPLLSLFVSLEALLLSSLLLIKQNRLSTEVKDRADLDLHIGLLTEHELTRVLEMLDDIRKRLGVEHPAAQELEDLKKETKPEDVLAEIARLQISAENRLETEATEENL